MAGLYHDGRNATARNIMRAYRYLRANPDGRIATGIWYEPEWGAAEFGRMIRRAVARKTLRGVDCRGRRHSAEWQRDMEHDARIIREYAARIRRRGTANLRLPENARRWPAVHNQMED